MMAATAIWKVKGNLGQVVNYAANPDKTTFSPADLQGLRDVMNYATQDYKTEEQRYVSGVNCIPEIARGEMMAVKRQFGKEDGIIAFHGYQSFAPGEVTPEQAHEIGVKLARKLWGDRFQVIVATHLDKKHIHNHFVLNSVSFVDGKKYNDCKATYLWPDRGRYPHSAPNGSHSSRRTAQRDEAVEAPPAPRIPPIAAFTLGERYSPASVPVKAKVNRPAPEGRAGP